MQKWIGENEKSQTWLADQINDLRERSGTVTRIGRSNLWRWMTGKTSIGVDDAMLIQIITGVPIEMWSKHRPGVRRAA